MAHSKRSAIIFWGAAALIAAVSAIALSSNLGLMSQYEASARSQRTLLELHRLVSGLKDVESGARSYALTGRPEFLEPYRMGKLQVQASLQQLHRFAGPEEVLALKLPRLEKLAERRIEIADDLVAIINNGRNEARFRANVDIGQRAMNDVRRESASLVAEQQQIHALRAATAQRWATIANGALPIGVILSIVMLLILFTRLNREIGKRQDVESELRTLNSELEQRVQLRTQEVEESRQLLSAVIDNMPDTVFLKDASDDFKYVMINRAGEKLLGRSRGDLIGNVDHELVPKGIASMCRKEDEAIAAGKIEALHSERMINLGNGVRSIESLKVPVTLDDGMKRYVLGVARDRTEHKSLERQVREMQRLEAVGQLTGGIAHDFNNLLAVTLGSVELLREQLADGSEAAALADEAINASARGADLVRRLLAFARKQHLEPTAIDLTERLPDIVPLLQRTLGETIELRVKTAKRLWHARIDPTQVDDALVNMAINARDAMPSGGTLTIETANVVLDEDYASHHVEVEPGEYVMLAVSDTGTGMSDETISRAFEPFFTTKKEGEGTGLGLSQVFGWVKQSSGHIKIYSELGHGTTFKLYLPRATEELTDTKKHFAQEQSPGGHETILVVEDNPNLRRTVVRQLLDLGYTPIESEDAKSALERVDSGVEFDLMLTDVVMPGGMSGYELATEVERRRPSTKIIFMSGYTELAATGLQTARNGPLLSKPYTKRDLGRAIRSALDDEGRTTEGEVAP